MGAADRRGAASVLDGSPAAGRGSLRAEYLADESLLQETVMDNGRVVHAGSMQALAEDTALQQSLLGLAL